MVGAWSAALLAGLLAFWMTSGRQDVVSAPTAGVLIPSSTRTPSTALSPPDGEHVAAATTTVGARTTGIPARPATVSTQEETPPDGLEIDRIGLRMPVRPVTVASDGEMALPTTPDVAGWYAYGPAPGSTSGASVIAGHVDTRADGVGPMAGLAALRVGDRVDVRSGDALRHYRVESVQSVHKTALDLPALFDRGGPPRLHLVTCGGVYDRVARHYEDNIVVVATPVA